MIDALVPRTSISELALPTTGQRSEARRVYGTDPVGYEAGRPEYPERVYELLTARCGAGRGCDVLEIGPGTGRVTRRLLALGASVVAVEPDAALVRYLRDLTIDGSFEVRESTFEDVPLADDSFDLAVAQCPFTGSIQRSAFPNWHE